MFLKHFRYVFTIYSQALRNATGTFIFGAIVSSARCLFETSNKPFFYCTCEGAGTLEDTMWTQLNRKFFVDLGIHYCVILQFSV